MASTTTGLSNLMQTLLDKKFLDRAKADVVYSIGAQVRTVPSNSGKTVVFNRFTPLASATTALTEATNPAGSDMTSTQVSATLAEYGDYVKVGSLFDLTSIDSGLMEHIDTIGQQASETVDDLIEAELDGGGTTVISNGAALSAVATSDTLDGQDVRTQFRKLRVAKAMRFESGLYKSIIPVSTALDLRGDSEWLDASRYTDTTNIKNGLIGKLHGVEFSETNNETINADAGAGNVDVYTTYFFGKNAYGMVDIAGTSTPKVYIKQAGSGGNSDPLHMFSTVGWKVTFVAKVLNSAWLIEFKSAASAGDNA